MAARILIVEDEEPLTLLLRYNLEAEGYAVNSAARGDDADLRLKESPPDLAIVDWMLPGLSGIELIRRLRGRAETHQLPVIMLTARGEEGERVRGLATGADDYIVKPFKPKELVARVRTRLRRTDQPSPETLQIGDLQIDVAGHSVKRDGEPIPLTPLEFDLLAALARKPWQVFTREVLLQEVWGYRHAADTRLVNVHVQRLRSKIEHDPERPQIVVTVRGVGYKAGPP